VWSISSCGRRGGVNALSRWRSVLVASVIVAAGSVGIAVERMALPVFTLTARDGAAVTSDRLVQPGTWALIYVGPHCVPCEAVLRSIDQAGLPTLKRRIVVVAASGPEAVLEEAARYPGLADAVWLADVSNAIPRQIRHTGVPAIFGMRNNMIEWSVAGVLMDATDVKSILANWLER